MQRLVAFSDAFARLLHGLAQVALVALLALVAHEVFVRYVLNAPTQFSVEVSEYLLVFISFAPAAWILRKGRHVRVSFAVDLLPQGVRGKVQAAGMALVAGFALVLVWEGTGMALTAWQGDDRSSSLLGAPLWLPYACIPLGSLALALAALSEAVQTLTRSGED